jgi:hypothetical protein
MVHLLVVMEEVVGHFLLMGGAVPGERTLEVLEVQLKMVHSVFLVVKAERGKRVREALREREVLHGYEVVVGCGPRE